MGMLPLSMADWHCWHYTCRLADCQTDHAKMAAPSINMQLSMLHSMWWLTRCMLPPRPFSGWPAAQLACHQRNHAQLRISSAEWFPSLLADNHNELHSSAGWFVNHHSSKQNYRVTLKTSPQNSEAPHMVKLMGSVH